MLRLPPFRVERPRSLEEAVAIKAEYGEKATYLAGGTDLLPKMKRGQQSPAVLIHLGLLEDLQRAEGAQHIGRWSDSSEGRSSEGRSSEDRGSEAESRTDGSNGGSSLGAGITLSALAASQTVQREFPALARAAAGVATPLVRNTATLGGNLCLDTRCNFYDQSHQWRKGIGFCMKKDGEACWVAPSSPRCWAVQSSDTAPVVVALGARIVMTGPGGSRTLPAEQFYRNDGIQYLAKDRDELVCEVVLPRREGAVSTYLKVSRRASFDFPVLGVAALVQRETSSAPLTHARVVLGALGSAPVIVEEAEGALVGKPLTEETIVEAAEAAWRRARPLDNTDQTRRWRKSVVRAYVIRALRALGVADA